MDRKGNMENYWPGRLTMMEESFFCIAGRVNKDLVMRKVLCGV